MTAAASACRVLLLTGPSGSGKTTVARLLARQADAEVLHADDIRVALEAQARGDEGATYHAGRAWAVDPRVSVASAVDAWGQVAALVSRALRPVVLMRVAYGDRLVLEGDTICPTMLHAPPLSQLAARGLLACALLVPRTRRQLAVHLRHRDRGFSVQSSLAQAREVERQWRYGRLLVARGTLGPPCAAIPIQRTPDATARLVARRAGWHLDHA